MARPPIVKNRHANLRCDNCGYRFVGWVPHVSIESEELGTIDWIPTKRSTTGMTCPACLSKSVEVAR